MRQKAARRVKSQWNETGRSTKDRKQDNNTIQHDNKNIQSQTKLKAQKSCAAHKHIRKRRTTLHFGRSFWKFRISLKMHQNWQFMKINLPQSEAPFQSLSMIRRSNTEALQYKRQIECNRITNDNQNINKTNEKHVKNYRSSRTPEDGRSLRSSITLWAEQLNTRFLLYESLMQLFQMLSRKNSRNKIFFQTTINF